MFAIEKEATFTKLRQVADRELTRLHPNWAAVRFVRSDYNEERYIWVLTYCVTYGHNSEGQLVRIEVYESCYADGSPAFLPAGVL